MTNQEKVLAALVKIDEPYAFTTDIAEKAGLTTKQTHAALSALLRKGSVVRGGPNDAYWGVK